MEIVPVVPTELSLSALELWGQHLVQYAQHRPIAIASSAVSLRGGLQGSSSSPPSTSHCHAAIGRLKRATLLQRLRLIRSFATKHPLAPSGLTCRPRLLPMPTSGQSVAETLQAMELRWVGSMQPSSRGTARLSSEMSASLPAWMTPSQTPRRHWSERQQQRQEQHQQQMQMYWDLHT